ncbi:MAG: RloB family protein [Caldilineaceae bacterium]
MAKRSRYTRFPKRNAPKRSPYDRVLIVCEGSKTEPTYFQQMIDHLKLNTANVKIDGDSDPAPRSVVQHAKKRHKEDGDFDRIYCVFDKDQHTTYEQAKSDISNARPSNCFFAVTSVPCFEYWLLLHFVYTTKPFAPSGVRTAADEVIVELKQHIPNYQKGAHDIFAQLIERTEQAIRHAEQANRQAEHNDTDNPTTAVHELVTYLQTSKTLIEPNF